jgi:hypothetical protein
MERETGIEPATFSLARRCSTTEPLPLMRYFRDIKIAYQRRFVNSLEGLLLNSKSAFPQQLYHPLQCPWIHSHQAILKGNFCPKQWA